MFAVGGGGSGICAVPPVGAGVFVAFIAGSTDDIVWLGSWLGIEDVVPEFAQSYTPNPESFVIKTSGGNVVMLSDQMGSEFVQLRTRSGMTIELNTTQQRLNIETTSGNRITLDDVTQSVSVSANNSIALSAPNVSIQATALNVQAASIDVQATSVSCVAAATFNLVSAQMGFVTPTGNAITLGPAGFNTLLPVGLFSVTAIAGALSLNSGGPASVIGAGGVLINGRPGIIELFGSNTGPANIQ
jgi:hypothetical protein